QGKAEVTTYALSQSRYGQPREGHAVLVFVTEDFHRDTQVKDEGNDADDAVKILKLNRIQRFATGIYDYSLMTSVFTPRARGVDPHTLKVSASIQDWCGHAWSQLNLDGDRYRTTVHSYFEAEADSVTEIPAAFLEDEAFNVIRIDPNGLPNGKIEAVPALFDARLRHHDIAPRTASATTREVEGGLREFELRYDDGRVFAITFEAAAPHRIESFREAVGDQETVARRTHRKQIAYWQHNQRGDAPLRAEIGLEPSDIGRK
ncbi:MAG: hypothetical protein KDB80_07895, partial [Planctomycetes bacterium]|nr:hypothetical protein [Planctomycetota bacterium]